MNRHDRRAWRSAQTWDDLGALTVAWLLRTLKQTPGHLGPPDPETIPLIPTLVMANAAGFVTTSSQQAGSGGYYGGAWEAWVSGLVPDHLMPALRIAITGTRLRLCACRGRQHGEHPKGCGCSWDYDTDWYPSRCPQLAHEIRQAWGVVVTDPVPDDNSVLWPVLERFAELVEVA